MAESELSCQDLQELADVLDDVVDVLNKTEVDAIRNDRVFDQRLGELIDALIALADIEENGRLSNNVEEMAEIWDAEGAWKRSEWNNFRRALDGAINSFERIRYKDCARD